LRIATQTNLKRRMEVESLCRSGLKLPIPYTLPFKFAIPANAGNISNDLPLSPGYGSEVRYIVVTLFDQLRTTWHSMNCSNIDGQTTFGKVASYQTKIGSTLLQVAALNCTSSFAGATGVYQDYEWNRKIGGDSPLYQSRLTYQQLWHHIDDFKASKPGGVVSPLARNMITGGLPLSGHSGTEQVIYNFSATLPPVTSALALIMFATFTKTLNWTDSQLLLL